MHEQIQFSDLIRNANERGWDFNNGDPELWTFSKHLVKPNGKVLDLGAQFARNSLPLALRASMAVDAYDTHPEIVKDLRSIAGEKDLPIEVHQEDIRDADFGREQYDLVLIGDVLSHLPSRAQSFGVLDKALDSLKPKGHIWLRAQGKTGSDYQRLARASRIGFMDCDSVKEIERDTFQIECMMHGGGHVDHRTFFDQTELMRYLLANNHEVVHSQVMPQKRTPNIMYGEDWPHPMWINSFITLIGQKRFGKP